MSSKNQSVHASSTTQALKKNADPKAVLAMLHGNPFQERIAVSLTDFKTIIEKWCLHPADGVGETRADNGRRDSEGIDVGGLSKTMEETSLAQSEDAGKNEFNELYRNIEGCVSMEEVKFIGFSGRKESTKPSEASMVEYTIDLVQCIARMSN